MMMPSYVGCLLDLQAAFPMPESECTGCARPSSPRPNPWRDRVLALEQDVDALRAQAEKDRLGEFHPPSQPVSSPSRSPFPRAYVCCCCYSVNYLLYNRKLLPFSPFSSKKTFLFQPAIRL